MGRMHTPGKGIARSAKPYRRTPPSWCKFEAAAVRADICKHAKKGMTPSQIGVVLRDSMGIPQVVSITGSKILRILKQEGNATTPTAKNNKNQDNLATHKSNFSLPWRPSEIQHPTLHLQVLPLNCLKIFTTSSKRLSTSASTWKETAPIPTPNSVLS